MWLPARRPTRDRSSFVGTVAKPSGKEVADARTDVRRPHSRAERGTAGDAIGVADLLTVLLAFAFIGVVTALTMGVAAWAGQWILMWIDLAFARFSGSVYALVRRGDEPISIRLQAPPIVRTVVAWTIMILGFISSLFVLGAVVVVAEWIWKMVK